MKFLAIIYNDESLYADATPEDIAATFAGARRVRRGGRQGGRVRRRRGPAADGHRDHGARARRRADADRRPVRGDQGAARRLLPARVQGPRRRAQLGGADPRGQDRARSRSARSWTTRRWRAQPAGAEAPPPDRPAVRPRRPPVPARVGTGGRRPRPHPRRPRPRRGGGAGRVPDRARALAARRRCRTTRRRWIVTAARNRALDRIRSEQRWAGRRVALEAELRALGGGEDDDEDASS